MGAHFKTIFPSEHINKYKYQKLEYQSTFPVVKSFVFQLQYLKNANFEQNFDDYDSRNQIIWTKKKVLASVKFNLLL